MNDYMSLVKAVNDMSGKLNQIYDVCLKYGHTSVTESVMAILGLDFKDGEWTNDDSDGR